MSQHPDAPTCKVHPPLSVILNINTVHCRHYVTAQALRLMDVTMATDSAEPPQRSQALDGEIRHHFGSEKHALLGAWLRA